MSFLKTFSTILSYIRVSFAVDKKVGEANLTDMRSKISNRMSISRLTDSAKTAANSTCSPHHVEH